MSLILDALKKSEAERRLGETPNLGTVPIWAPKRERSLLWWAVIPLVVVVSAALWSNRDLINGKLVAEDEETPSPTMIAAKPNLKPAATNTSSTAARGRNSSAIENTSRPAAVSARKSDLTVKLPGEEAKNARNSRALPMPKPVVMPQQTVADLDTTKGAASADRPHIENNEPIISNASPTAKRGPTSHVQAASVETELPPPPKQAVAMEAIDNSLRFTPAPAPTTSTTANPAANTVQNPVSSTSGSIAVTPPTTNQATVSAAGSRDASSNTLTLYDLTLGQRQGLPELKMSMHVYHNDPQRRFAIIDGKRLNQGGAIGTDLLVKEIVANGVLFEYRGIRFLLPRVGG